MVRSRKPEPAEGASSERRGRDRSRTPRADARTKPSMPRAQAKLGPEKIEAFATGEPAAEPRLPQVVPMPDAEQAPAPVSMVAAPLAPAEPFDAGRAQASEPQPAAAPADAMDRLRGMTLVYWRDHLERTMATGQAIMTCGSPQAAVRLQIGYLQSSLRCGFEQAGELTRLHAEIARDMLTFRGR